MDEWARAYFPAKTGANKIWAWKYSTSRKVTSNLAGSSCDSMVANLYQNPSVFPLVSVFLPTLLRRGLMFLIVSERCQLEPRPMLASEHLAAMGFPIYAHLISEKQHITYPLWTATLVDQNMKSIAGPAHRPQAVSVIGHWCRYY